MPNVRKLTPEEVREIEERDQRRSVSRDGGRLRVREEPPPHFDERYFTTRPAPRLGDIVKLKGGYEGRGIIVRVIQRDTGWLAAEVLIGDELHWLDSSKIGSPIGRPRGISRIDQPRRRTHGWFVRLYEGSATRLARMFSDRKHAGSGHALKAAIDFHSANDKRLESREVGLT
jgi:signal peptidase I